MLSSGGTTYRDPLFLFIWKTSMFDSTGLKRIVASILLMLAGMITASGSVTLAFLVPILQKIAAGLGAAGIIHAGFSGTIQSYLLATMSAILAIAQTIPAFADYVPLLQYIATLLGAAALGRRLFFQSPIEGSIEQNQANARF
jgi:hypothetical protein